MPATPQKPKTVNVLIALVGTSPAVVTESVEALCRPDDRRRLAFVPDKIVLVTTKEGRASIQDELLGKSQGASRWSKARNNLGLAGDVELEIVTPGDDPDAHAEDELEHMGDLVFTELRKYTSKDDTVVCVSLSGGRKSMSHFAGTACSLLARPKDFLIHVLVDPPSLERCPDFYYREKSRDESYSWDDPYLGPTTVRQSNIQLRMSHVPFVRMRDWPKVEKILKNHAAKSLYAVLGRVNAGGEIPQKTLIYRSSQPGKIFLDGEDLSKFPALDTPLRVIAALKLLAEPGGLSTNPDKAERERFTQAWNQVNTSLPPRGKDSLTLAAENPFKDDFSRLRHAMESVLMPSDQNNYRIRGKGGKYTLENLSLEWS